MKLIGSMVEEEFRAQLIRSNQSLFSAEGDHRLIKLLKVLYPQMVTAYIMDWIPEQGEDFYEILINDDVMAKIELSHNDDVAPVAESIITSQYLHKRSKAKQIELAVALCRNNYQKTKHHTTYRY
jgi:hypothetical protein